MFPREAWFWQFDNCASSWILRRRKNESFAFMSSLSTLSPQYQQLSIKAIVVESFWISWGRVSSSCERKKFHSKLKWASDKRWSWRCFDPKFSSPKRTTTGVAKRDVNWESFFHFFLVFFCNFFPSSSFFYIHILGHNNFKVDTFSFHIWQFYSIKADTKMNC